jgi:hypothetical protein
LEPSSAIHQATEPAKPGSLGFAPATIIHSSPGLWLFTSFERTL